nr:LapA family protein [Actinomycetota bacterium]
PGIRSAPASAYGRPRVDALVPIHYVPATLIRLVTTGAAVALAVGIDAASAATHGRLSILAPGAGARAVTLELDRTPLGREGALNLVVRNDGSTPGRVRVRFFPDARGRVVPLQEPGTRTFPRTHPVLFSTSKPLTAGRFALRPAAIRALPLLLGIANDAKAEAADGVLVIDLRDRPAVRPAVLRIRGSIPQAAAPKVPAAQPAKVVVRVTRWWPLSLRDDERRVHDSPRAWVPGTPSTARALLSGDGHEIEVKLGAANASADTPPGLKQQPVELVGGADAGTYTGDLVLVTGGTEKVAVEAKVRDFVLWPLLAVAIGAILGGFATTWWQLRRRNDILVAELRRARDEYRKALADRPPDSPLSPLDGPLTDEAVTALEKEIAAAREGEEFDALTERVRSIRNEARQWAEIETAVEKLLAAHEATPRRAPDVRGDSEAVLAQTRWLPSTAEGIAELVRRLRRQERLARSFTSAYHLHEEGAIAAYRPDAYESDTKTAECLGSLAQVQVPPEIQLDRAAFLEELDPRDADRRTLDRFMLNLIERRTREQEARPRTFELLVRDIPPSQTPEEIERGVRVWDKRLAALAFAGTVLTYFIAKYDADFGSWEDYVTAFGAGFGGQAVGAAVWSLFPALRSYALPAAKKT